MLLTEVQAFRYKAYYSAHTFYFLVSYNCSGSTNTFTSMLLLFDGIFIFSGHITFFLAVMYLAVTVCMMFFPLWVS